MGMKLKPLVFIACLVAVGIAAASSFPQRFKWQMSSCPAGTGYDENFQPQCIAPQACDGGGFCTGGAPTASTDGMSLRQVHAFRITVCAPPQQLYSDAGVAAQASLLQGAGSIQVYGYHAGEAKWTRDPGLDQNISVTATSCGNGYCQCQSFPNLEVGVEMDRVYVAAVGVTQALPDAGHVNDAGLDVLIDGQPSTNVWPY